MKRVFSGIAASPGIGVGRALLYREAELNGWEHSVKDVAEELERYRSTVEQFYDRAERQALQVAETVGSKQGEILHSQAVMARDPYLSGQVESRIASRQCAESALIAACGLFIDFLSASDDEMVRLRAADVRAVRNGMLRILTGLPEADFSRVEPGVVLIADELSPFTVSGLDSERVAALVLRTGGRSSHCAILARAMGIPMVMGAAEIISKVGNGETMVVDGSQGKVYSGLSPEEAVQWRRRQKEQSQLMDSLRQFVHRDTLTADGARIALGANVGNEGDVLRAEEVGYDGVGLFRSEFLYQGREALPSEEEQFQVYRRMALAMKGRPLVIRTLDAGGDKSLPYLEQGKEENPQLGCRGLRLCFREEAMFLAQLRAILRAGAFGDVRLMLPMLTGIGELRQAKLLLEQAKEELRQKGTPFREDLPLGVTMETAAAAAIADLLAKEVDFFSIGTNDLTQYVMAVDRNNSLVAGLCSYFHPAVLRAVRHIVTCGGEAGIPVALCGEAASDPLYLPLLLGFGMDTFSVPPTLLLSVRKVLSQWTKREAEELTRQALSLSTEAEVRTLMRESLRL